MYFRRTHKIRLIGWGGYLYKKEKNNLVLKLKTNEKKFQINKEKIESGKILL